MTTNPWDIQDVTRTNATAEEVYLSVGRALSEWEGMEHHFAWIFGFYCGGREPFAARRAYGSVISFSGRSEMLRRASEAYFHSRPGHQMQDRFDKILDRAGKFSPRRNEIAHGVVTAIYEGTNVTAVNFWTDQRYLLLPTEYATNKNVLRPFKGRPETEPRYVYSSVEIDGYGKEFTAMRNQLFSLMIDWESAFPGQSPEIPL